MLAYPIFLFVCQVGIQEGQVWHVRLGLHTIQLSAEESTNHSMKHAWRGRIWGRSKLSHSYSCVLCNLAQAKQARYGTRVDCKQSYRKVQACILCNLVKFTNHVLLRICPPCHLSRLHRFRVLMSQQEYALVVEGAPRHILETYFVSLQSVHT